MNIFTIKKQLNLNLISSADNLSRMTFEHHLFQKFFHLQETAEEKKKEERPDPVIAHGIFLCLGMWRVKKHFPEKKKSVGKAQTVGGNYSILRDRRQDIQLLLNTISFTLNFSPFSSRYSRIECHFLTGKVSWV